MLVKKGNRLLKGVSVVTVLNVNIVTTNFIILDGIRDAASLDTLSANSCLIFFDTLSDHCL